LKMFKFRSVKFVSETVSVKRRLCLIESGIAQTRDVTTRVSALE
jgi:hypothetical protein